MLFRSISSARQEEKARDRVLKDAELRAIWKATVTGRRRGTLAVFG
jgi:hypothetical protein